MTPWEEKRSIEYAHELAELCGFQLVRDFRYHYDKVALQAKPDTDVWAQDMALETFDTWAQAITFLAGYRKAMMYYASGGKLK
jgi:hypothetical protein